MIYRIMQWFYMNVAVYQNYVSEKSVCNKDVSLGVLVHFCNSMFDWLKFNFEVSFWKIEIEIS